MLIDALKETYSQKRFKLAGLRVNQKMSEALASFFSDPNCKVEDLALDELQMDDKSAQILLGSLHDLKGLRLLSFCKNELTPEICNELVELCHEHPTMELFDLSHCEIGKDSM